MGFLDFLKNLGKKSKDTAQELPQQAGQALNDAGSSLSDAVQSVPGVDVASQAGQNVTEAVSGVTDAAQNAASQATEHLSNLSDKIPKL